MKILATLFGRAIKDFSYAIEELNNIEEGISVNLVTLDEYLLLDQDDYDVLLYNTFPNEQHWKFNKEIVDKCDLKFHAFKGLKILLDTYDNGTLDGFCRFNDFSLPRIKANPSYDMIKKMNLIITIPYFVSQSFCQPKEKRTYEIVCAMRTMGMPFVRRNTGKRIKNFKPDVRWLPIRKHAKRLCRALINIVPTGTGDSSKSHAHTLAAGALLMAEENIENIKILPNIDLEEGKHFISYNLDNIGDKLDYLLNNRDYLDSVRMAGLDAFRVGYDCNKNARKLVDYIKANI